MAKQLIPLVDASSGAIPVWPVTEASAKAWLAAQPAAVSEWLKRQGFKIKPGKFQVVPTPKGGIAGIVLGVSANPRIWDFALADVLPRGRYRLAPISGSQIDARAQTQAALGWALSSYRFGRYRKADPDHAPADLQWPARADRAYVVRAYRSFTLVRDLINTPAGDLGPADFARVALQVAKDVGAKATTVIGQNLVRRGFGMIHGVGKGASQEPRLVDLRWGRTGPRVTLVGKGVCFDTGGLDLKSADGMLLMKKDMAGAAIALGLFRMLADAKFPIRLRALLPMAENSVSAESFRPGDILTARNGLTVEIGNTDAEGRLLLGDALAEADLEKPDLLIDFSTLTGAARVALGPDLPAMYSTDDAVAAELAALAEREADPLWRMPLWDGYMDMLASKIADTNNISGGSFAGSITAALFLKKFVAASPRWVHLDLYAWNPKPKPGRPEGGEAQTMRAIYRLIEQRYGGRR